MANRRERRRQSAIIRKQRIQTMQVRPMGVCDVEGCGLAWEFVTMAGVGKDRKPILRRCPRHAVK